MKFFWLFFLPSMLQAQAHFYLGMGAGRLNANTAIYSSFIGEGVMGIESHGIGAEVSVGHVAQVTSQSLRDGTLTMIPIMFNFSASPHLSKHWRLMGKAGLSYVLCDRELSPWTLRMEGYPNYKVSEEIKSGIGFQIGGGPQYQVNRNVAIGFEVMQLFFTSTIKHTRRDMNNLRDDAPTYIDEGPIDLGTIIGTIVIKYYF